MDPTEPSIIEHSIEKTHVWLKELDGELGSEDRRYAYRALRAVLHAIRDRLPVNEAAHLASQLPTLIRGIYYEDWSPGRTPTSTRDARAFLDRVASEASLSGATEASIVVAAVAKILREHVSEGEFDDVIGALPTKIKPLIEA